MEGGIGGSDLGSGDKPLWPAGEMGKSNSKLKPEVVEELCRKTYCEYCYLVISSMSSAILCMLFILPFFLLLI